MRLNLNCNKREVIIIMMSTSIVLRLGYNFPVTHWRSDLNFFGQITRITVKMLFKLSDVASEASNLDSLMLHDWPPEIVIGDVPLAHLDTISDPEDRGNRMHLDQHTPILFSKLGFQQKLFPFPQIIKLSPNDTPKTHDYWNFILQIIGFKTLWSRNTLQVEDLSNVFIAHDK